LVQVENDVKTRQVLRLLRSHQDDSPGYSARKLIPGSTAAARRAGM
jgi:hypothetical protein